MYEKDKIKRPDICKLCNKKISYITQPICFKCGKQLDCDEREFCADCTKKEHFFTRGVAGFAYSDALKDSMYAFKYNNRREYAQFYAKTVVKEFGNIIDTWKAEALIPVPMYKAKQDKRGYNQAFELSKALSKYTSLPTEDVLVRVKNTTPQKELDEKERINNIKNAFQIRKNGLKYSKIVLVDDIYTTGATIDECARELLQAGVSQIYFITACIGRGF